MISSYAPSTSVLKRSKLQYSPSRATMKITISNVLISFGSIWLVAGRLIFCCKRATTSKSVHQSIWDRDVQMYRCTTSAGWPNDQNPSSDVLQRHTYIWQLLAKFGRHHFQKVWWSWAAKPAVSPVQIWLLSLAYVVLRHEKSSTNNLLSLAPQSVIDSGSQSAILPRAGNRIL